MEKNFSTRIHTILKYSREEALRLKNDYISTEHILLGFLKDGESNIVSRLLKKLNCNPKELKFSIEKIVKPLPVIVMVEEVPLTKRAENVLKRAWVEANSTNSIKIDLEHLFLALLQEKEGVAASVLDSLGITYDKVKNELESLSKPKEIIKKTTNEKKQPEADSISNYGYELTKLAQQNKLDPVIGRDKEIERMLRILSRKKKNNPLIIGEPGVGKTSIVEGLADRIVQKKVPLNLYNTKIFYLDLSSLVAGAALRGQFEERIKSLLNKEKAVPSKLGTAFFSFELSLSPDYEIAFSVDCNTDKGICPGAVTNPVSGAA